jgi:hypothetical protein
MPRNPGTPHRHIEGNAERTMARVNQYRGKLDLLATWEKAPMAMQCRNHDYVLKLRARVRNVRNYVLHRAGPDADL